MMLRHKCTSEPIRQISYRSMVRSNPSRPAVDGYTCNRSCVNPTTDTIASFNNEHFVPHIFELIRCGKPSKTGPNDDDVRCRVYIGFHIITHFLFLRTEHAHNNARQNADVN